MTVGNGIRCIWLDRHIGKNGEYQDFKRNFQTTLAEAAAVPPDAVDVLICAIEENTAPFSFVQTPDQAITLIENYHDKQIIFISSGSLGQHMLARISQGYPHVYRIYFFCRDIPFFADLCFQYGGLLQIFDHETDLVVRLARDISEDIIEQGRTYIDLGDRKNALKCFESARILNVKANESDTLNDPCVKYLRQLHGYETQAGLIERAKDLIDQQGRSTEEGGQTL